MERRNEVMTTLRLGATRAATRVPTNLAVFIAAIFLSNGVNVFTTIYATPGRPVHSPQLWCSAIASIAAAGFWTALAAKKDHIEKAVLSGSADPLQRGVFREQMWADVSLRVTTYLSGAVVTSILAMVILVLPT